MFYRNVKDAGDRKKKNASELLQIQHTNDLGFITSKSFFGVSKYMSFLQYLS